MRARLVTLATAAIGLVACAGADPVTPGAAEPDSPVGSTPGLPTPVPGPSALEVSPRPGLVDVRPHMWDRFDQVGPRKVRIEFYGGVEECEGLDRVEVEEMPKAVTVTLYVGRVPEAEVCIEIAVLKSVIVRVDAPINGREIIDGAEGN
jgi:hypothetical protein